MWFGLAITIVVAYGFGYARGRITSLKETLARMRDNIREMNQEVQLIKSLRESLKNAEVLLKSPEVHWECQQKIDQLEAQLTERSRDGNPMT